MSRVGEDVALEAAAAGLQAYGEGDFAGAVAAHEMALAAGAEAPGIYVQLGNALYRQGRKGEAIWAWEQALLGDPRDEAADANLARVRAELRLPHERPLASKVAPDDAAAFAAAFFSLACFFLILRRTGRLRQLLAVFASLALASFLVCGAGLIASLAHRDAGRAVVLLEAELRDAPDDAARGRGSAQEGSVVRVERELGAWVFATLPSGRSGWLPRDRVSPVGALR